MLLIKIMMKIYYRCINIKFRIILLLPKLNKHQVFITLKTWNSLLISKKILPWQGLHSLHIYPEFRGPLKSSSSCLWRKIFCICGIHRRKKLGNYSLSPLKLSFCPFNNLKEQIQNIQTDLTNYYPFPFCFNSSCATLLQVFEVKTSDFLKKTLCHPLSFTSFILCSIFFFFSSVTFTRASSFPPALCKILQDHCTWHRSHVCTVPPKNSYNMSECNSFRHLSHHSNSLFSFSSTMAKLKSH